MTDPVTVRDAATVILVRDAPDDAGRPAVEVCMLRRNLASEFVAGVYVFPGGSVDPDDRDPALAALCRGRTDAEASAVLGLRSGGLALWVAALRECFEEAGVLLAHPVDGVAGSLLDTGDPATAARFAAHRDGVNDGTRRLLDVCAEEGLVLSVGGMYYVSHWITPELAPRRYDTRFFIAAAPPGQVARHDDGETIATIWVRPSDALARQRDGEIELLPPTMANLAAIEGCADTAEVLAWAGQVTDVPTILPIVLVEDGQLLILRPGDVGYPEALADRLESGSEMGDYASELVRRHLGPKPAGA